jgi:glycosyltransferase involved in cell wall biosynthesis
MNNTKTIWYLNHYIPSYRSPKKGRPFYLLNAVAKMGFNVAVIGASKHHLGSDDIEQKGRFCFQHVEHLLFGWIRTPHYSGNGIKRIHNMLSYAWQLLLLGSNIPDSHSRPDVIVVSSVHPFHYPVALWLSKRYKAKIVFEVRDIWPLTLHDLIGLSKSHPLYLLLGGIENLAYRTADSVISLMKNGLLHMERHGLKAEKFHYIPNGVDFSVRRVSYSHTHESELKILKNNYDFILMYTGAHGVPNALDQLLSAAAITDSLGFNIAYVLIGEGAEKKRLLQRAKDEGLSHVFFLDSVPSDHVQNLLEYASACFIGWQNKSIYQYGVSANKLFEYMKSCKPIIQCIDSPNNPVVLSGCGIDVQPNRPDLLAGVIIDFSQKTPHELIELGNNGYGYAMEEHNYSKLATKFIEACDV